MAIALDTTASSADSTSSPFTWNHTCTGSNLLLVVGISLQAGTQPTATGVTYNGVAMNNVKSVQYDGGTGLKSEESVWFLHAPATGSALAISVTATMGTLGHGSGTSVSYTGVNQVDTADSVSGTNTGTTTGDKTFPVVTVADNCWIFGVGICGALSPTITADQTSRGTVSMATTVASVHRAEDTNAPLTPPGSQTVGFTVGGTALAYNLIAAAFAPSGGGTATYTYTNPNLKALNTMGVGT